MLYMNAPSFNIYLKNNFKLNRKYDLNEIYNLITMY